MTFAARMKGIINKGVAEAQDLGARGVLKLEIMKLQARAEKLMAKLGSEVYRSLVDRDHTTVSRDTPAIRDFLREITNLRERKDVKEMEFRSFVGKKKAALEAAGTT